MSFLFLANRYLLVFRWEESGKALEGRAESIGRTEADTVGYGLEGHIPIIIIVVNALTGFLYSILIDERIEVVACNLIDNLRHILRRQADRRRLAGQREIRLINLISHLKNSTDTRHQLTALILINVVTLIFRL